MKTFTISQKCPVMFGEGSSQLTGKKLAELGCKKVLAIYDHNIEKLGLSQPIIDCIEAEGIEVARFDKVLPDAPSEIITEGGELFHQEKCDAIVGIGGGSSMDVAKGVRVLSTNPAPISKYYGRAPMEPGVPMLLIPTTVGTGSEVSIAAVIYDKELGKKPAILNAALQATLAIVDPVLSRSMPHYLIACSGMDIMLHAVETCLSTYRNPSSTIMAHGVLNIVARALPLAMKEETSSQACADLAFASTYCAMAFNDAMLHVGHHIAHALGAFFHTAHGECCSITIPSICKYFAEKMPAEMQGCAKALGLNPDSAMLGDDLANYYQQLSKSIGLHTARELEYDLEKMLTMIPAVHGRVVEPNTATPLDVTEEDLKQILTDIYNR